MSYLLRTIAFAFITMMALGLAACAHTDELRVPRGIPLIAFTFADCAECTYRTHVDLYRNGVWHQYVEGLTMAPRTGRINGEQVSQLYSLARSFHSELLLLPSRAAGASASWRPGRRYMMGPDDLRQYRASLIEITGLQWDTPACGTQCPVDPAHQPRGSVTFIDSAR